MNVRRPLNNARGVIIIWFALFLLVTLFFIALGVDVAKLATTRTQLQNAADAAALAGASAINPATGDINPVLAQQRAAGTAIENKAFVDGPEPVALQSPDISLLSGRRVKVIARRQAGNSMLSHFAQVLDLPKLEMTATATAKAETTHIAECGIVPLGANPVPGSPFQPGCGQQYQLKAGGGGGTNGNYGALDLGACGNGECIGGGGGSSWGCLMEHGYCCDVAVGDVVFTEPGDMSGPLSAAIDARFAADAVKIEGICYEDYLAAGGTGQRVIFVPTVTTLPNGRGPVTITGFSAFFVMRRTGSGAAATLDGEFIYAVIPGSGGGGVSGGPAVYSVHLVPNP